MAVFKAALSERLANRQAISLIWNDSDGHTLELSFGQEIGLAVAESRESRR